MQEKNRCLAASPFGTLLGAFNLGRETALQKLVWQDGWPWLEGESGADHPNKPKRSVPAPDLPEHRFSPELETDDFDYFTYREHARRTVQRRTGAA